MKTDAQRITELEYALARTRTAYTAALILLTAGLISFALWAMPRGRVEAATPTEVCNYEIDVERFDGEGVYPVTLLIREFDNATVTAAYIDPFE